MGRPTLEDALKAYIAPEIIEFFAGLDLQIHEVYGQSEDSGPTSFNSPGRTRVGSFCHQCLKDLARSARQ